MEKKWVTDDLEAKLQRPSRHQRQTYSAEEGESEKKEKMLIRDGERDKEGKRKGEGENKEVFMECKADFFLKPSFFKDTKFSKPKTPG